MAELENISTFEQREDWINKKKEEGNIKYKESLFPEAIDIYLKALYGFGFD